MTREEAISGVFVPNMEKPKACDYCIFHDSGWSWCKAKDTYCGNGKCPLIDIEIPITQEADK